MSGVKWKNTSSFSQGDKDRTPNCWTTKAGRIRIVVHRHIHHAPDVWLLSCDALRIGNELKSRDIEDAKGEALAIVRTFLEEAIAGLTGPIK